VCVCVYILQKFYLREYEDIVYIVFIIEYIEIFTDAVNRKLELQLWGFKLEFCD